MAKQFDLLQGEKAKAEGMKAAAEARPATLIYARAIAFALASEHGTVNADMVGEKLKERGYNPNLGPAAGSLFKGDEWEFTGERVRSKRVTNHGRELKVWKLKENAG